MRLIAEAYGPPMEEPSARRWHLLISQLANGFGATIAYTSKKPFERARRFSLTAETLPALHTALIAWATDPEHIQGVVTGLQVRDGNTDHRQRVYTGVRDALLHAIAAISRAT